MTAIALRPFLPTDARRCAAIFRDAVDVLAAEDYSDEQRTAWASRADDAMVFGAKLADCLTLLALVEGEVAGFASLKNLDLIDMLYVDPAFARRGIGTALIDALGRIAQSRGATRLTSEVSDNAKPLFDREGFVAQRRNLAPIADEWLANTTMTKPLAPANAKPASDKPATH
jgi:putative acetyltransferase